MCVESVGWGKICTNVDDGVHRCWVRGWVLVQGRVTSDQRVGSAHLGENKRPAHEVIVGM